MIMRQFFGCTLRLIIFCLTMMGHTAGAQTAPVTLIDYTEWEAEAERAESLIVAGRASTVFLENLRANLVEWRTLLGAADNVNQARIETIEAQITALGPAPGADETEPAPLAERRAELVALLDAAQVPRRTATEAFTRADGLIAEIDAILTERQAQALFRLDPTPLNPIHWTGAAVVLRDIVVDQTRVVRGRWADAEVRATAQDRLNGTIVIFTFGLYLLVLARGQVARWARRYDLEARHDGHLSIGYLVTFAQLILPFLGAGFVVVALSRIGLIDPSLRQLIVAFLGWPLSIFAAIWLAGHLFPSSETQEAALNLAPDDRGAARRAMVTIGVFIGLSIVVQTIIGFGDLSTAVRGVFFLPVHLGLAFGFWRFAKILRNARAAFDGQGPPPVPLRGAGGAARILFAVAIVGPVLAIVGYAGAAQALTIPVALTLAVVSVLLSLQPIIRDLYAVIFRSSAAAAAEALVPVLVNFVLVLAVLPLVALIWGMRPERLGELYARAVEGVMIGETRITPATILAAIVVFSLGFAVTRIVQGTLKTTVLPRTRLDLGSRNAIAAGVGYLGIALALIIAVTAAGIDLTALGFVVGALSVGIGFGLQNVVSNFVSGIILLIERPISEGDWIEVGGHMGIVKAISVRSTRIETFNRTDVIVPNADFVSGTVTNWTRGNTIGRAVVNVGVAYGADTRHVQAILLEIAKSHPVVTAFPEPAVDFVGFGADSLDFRIRATLRDVNVILDVQTEIHHQIAERFAAEGIEIPFAQRDVWLRNPDVLHTGAPRPINTND